MRWLVKQLELSR